MDDIPNRVVMQQDPPNLPVGSGNSTAGSNATGTGAAGGNGTGVSGPVEAGPGGNGTVGGANSSGGSGVGAGGDGGMGGGISATQGPRDSGGGGLFDVEGQVNEIATTIKDAMQEMAEWAFDAAIELIVGTGAPNRIVGPPTNEPWLTFYNYAQGDVATISMILFAFVIAAIAAVGTFAGIFSAYKTQQLWWRAGAALVFDFLWWPIGAASLQVLDWLAIEIAPAGSEFTSSIEGAIAGVAGTAIGGAVVHTVSTGAMLLLGLLYGARWVALAALLVFMRVLVMLWVVDASVLARLSNLASGFMGMFVPLLVMPLPTAMLMRIALLFFMAAASGNAGILGGPVLLFIALGTLVASVFAPKFTFDYARSFMAQSFGAEKIGKQLDAQLNALGAGLADRASGSGTTTATLETPPALPPGDPTATPAPASGGSGAPAASATTPAATTATGSAYSTTAPSTATGSTDSTTSTAGSGVVDRANIRASMSDDTPSQPTTWEALNEDFNDRGENVNKYLQENEYSTDEQRLESRRRQLRRDTPAFGGDD